MNDVENFLCFLQGQLVTKESSDKDSFLSFCENPSPDLLKHRQRTFTSLTTRAANYQKCIKLSGVVRKACHFREGNQLREFLKWLILFQSLKHLNIWVGTDISRNPEKLKMLFRNQRGHKRRFELLIKFCEQPLPRLSSTHASHDVDEFRTGCSTAPQEREIGRAPRDENWIKQSAQQTKAPR